MAERAVSVDSSSGVVIPKVNWSTVVSRFLYPKGDLWAVSDPALNEATECWDVDGSSCCAGRGDEWLMWSGVCSDWLLAFTPSPVACEDFFKWLDHALSHFASLPQAFNAYCFYIMVSVEVSAIGWITPRPAVLVAKFFGVIV